MNKKQKMLCNLYGHNFPRSVAWGIDYDYQHLLSPKEQEWLAKFNQAYYQADFSSLNWNKKEKRKRYTAKNSANRDMYTKFERVEKRKKSFRQRKAK